MANTGTEKGQREKRLRMHLAFCLNSALHAFIKCISELRNVLGKQIGGRKGGEED